MNKHIKSFTIFSLILLFSLSFLAEVDAQCPMCRMAVESNLKDGGTAGKGLNAGILYMLLTPYFIIGTIGFVWWRNRGKEEVEIEAES